MAMFKAGDWFTDNNDNGMLYHIKSVTDDDYIIDEFIGDYNPYSIYTNGIKEMNLRIHVTDATSKLYDMTAQKRYQKLRGLYE